MKKTLRNIEPEVIEEKPFHDCKLDREKYAINLTRIIENYPGGFVLALNNRWGDGKTFFVNRWRQYLKNEGFQTIYFNAWKDDYSENPLLAIIAELSADIENPNKKLLEIVIEAGTPIFSRSIPVILKAAIKKGIGTKGLDEIAEIIGEEIGKPFEKLIHDYKKQKESIKRFKDALSAFAEESGSGKPVVFFIDELDRCKPSYAVEILELIKHLFDVENIVYVLSLDKDQLSNSVKGYYGSEHINGNEYLKRFFDIEFVLPQADLEKTVSHFYNLNNLEKLFIARLPSGNYRRDIQEFKLYSQILFENQNLNLRTISKIFTQTQLAIYSFGKTAHFYPSTLIFLIFLFNESKSNYNRIRNRQITSPDLLKLHNEMIQAAEAQNQKISEDFLEWTEVDLIYLNENHRTRNGISQLIDNRESFLKTFQDSSINAEELYKNIQKPYSIPRKDEVAMKYILDKIEFTEDLIIN